jgi:hypothetical protein
LGDGEKPGTRYPLAYMHGAYIVSYGIPLCAGKKLATYRLTWNLSSRSAGDRTHFGSRASPPAPLRRAARACAGTIRRVPAGSPRRGRAGPREARFMLVAHSSAAGDARRQADTVQAARIAATSRVRSGDFATWTRHRIPEAWSSVRISRFRDGFARHSLLSASSALLGG